MVNYIILGALIVAELVFTPIFIKAQFPKPSFKSLCLKMLCSAIFVAIGVVSVIESGAGFSSFQRLILAGLVCGFVGDFFLHVKPKFCFVIGFIAFLAGHVIYICAFSSMRSEGFFNAIETAAFAVIICIIVTIVINLKIDFKAALFPCLIYGCMITVMFIKACELGIATISAGGALKTIFSSLFLMVGALLFLLSDVVIALLIFDEKYKKMRALKRFNLWTYYLGQSLIALSLITM